MRDHTRLYRTGLQLLMLLCALPYAFLPMSAQAVVPGEVNYQGLLLDDLGDPVTGPVSMVFRLYLTDSGGSALWTESHATVDVLDGVYEVALGSVVPLASSLFDGGTVKRAAAITRVRELAQEKKKLVETERRLEEWKYQAMTAEQVMTIVSLLSEIIEEEVEEPGVIARIRTRFLEVTTRPSLKVIA